MGIGSALGRVFKKIGGGLASPTAIKALKVVSPMIPVAGPVMATAVELVGSAEGTFPESGAGPTLRKPWVRHQLAKRLREEQLEEKRIDALIELALLVYKGEAKITKPKKASKTDEAAEKAADKA